MNEVVRAASELRRFPLAVPAGGSGVRSVDLLVMRLSDADGAEGFGLSYVIDGRDELPLLAARLLLERFVIGASVDDPPVLWRQIDASFNRTGGGPYRTALAAIDVAAWDLHARRLGVPLGVAMGGAPRAVPVYGSGGFRAQQPPDEAAEVARDHLRRGVRAVKPRATGAASDAALLAAVAATGAEVMVDANERCSPETARQLLEMAAAVGALFVEEPLPAGDVAAYRTLARIAAVPLACGEHLRSLAAFEPFLHDRLCVVLQPDLQALGGLTPALALAQRAAAAGIAIAPHFLPGLFVHVAAAASAVTWLEDFPLVEPLLRGLPVVGADGTMMPTTAAGHGIDLRDDAPAVVKARAKSP